MTDEVVPKKAKASAKPAKPVKAAAKPAAKKKEVKAPLEEKAATGELNLIVEAW